MAQNNLKTYGILITVFVIALVVVIYRSAVSGVVWNPLGLDFGNTRPAKGLPDYVYYLLEIAITLIAIAGVIYVQRRFARVKQ
jgi:hypothetical protein